MRPIVTNALAALAVSFGLAAAQAATAAPAKWSCMKDGAEVTVDGKSTKDKKKACKAQGGVWAKSAASGNAAAGAGGGAKSAGSAAGGTGGGW